MKDQPLPSPEIADYRRRRNLLILLVSVGIVIAVVARPIYRYGKTLRVRHLAGKAEKLMGENKIDEATLQARAAYQLKPQDPDAIRIMARLSSKTSQPAKAVFFWEQLQTLQVNTPEDDFQFAEDLFRVGTPPRAIQILNTLLEKNPSDPKTLRLASRIYLEERNLGKSLELAKKAVDYDPGNAEGKYLLGILQSAATDPNIAKKGRDLLFDVGDQKDQSGMDALNTLAGMPDINVAETMRIIEKIRANPFASTKDKLSALGLEISLNPSQADRLMDEAAANFQDSPPSDKRAVAVWLNNRKEFDRTITFLPLKEATARQDLLLVHLDALASLKRWEEIQNILKSGVPLEAVFVELFTARCLMELGEPAKANLHWNRAHTAAAPSLEQTLYIVAYAEKLGQYEQAERACRALVSNARTARPAYDTLLRFAQRKQDTRAIQQILEEMHKQWPSDPAISNDYAYMSLLLKVDIANCLEIARKLVEKNPSSLPHRSTLALAYLRTGATASALKVYEGIQITWASVNQSHLAVFVAVLAANKMDENVTMMSEKLRVNELRPEERALLGK